MFRFINRNYSRTEHDDYMLNVQPYIGEQEESMEIWCSGMSYIVGWKIQPQFE